MVQFMTQEHKPSTQMCENKRNSALIEHFFNVVFGEFQTVPPVCVCVQMCMNQATYCYPNGCLKRSDQRHRGGHRIATTTATSERLIESVRANVDNNFDINSFKERHEQPEQTNIQPDIFQERYKLLFKYKKLPKVELRYHLREHSKNTIIDRMKWDRRGMRTITKILNGQQKHFNEEDRQNINYQRYFKRDASEEKSKENLASLDNFTKKLLEVKIELLKNTSVLDDFEVSSNYKLTEVASTDAPEITVSENYNSTNIFNANKNNILENFTNATETEEESKNENESDNGSKIKNQSKMCSNTSMEFIDSFTDSFEDNNKPDTFTKGSFVSKRSHSIETSTSTGLTTVMFTNKMKSKQRITRRFQKMKIY